MFIKEFYRYATNKSLITVWLNNLLVLYAFLLPISQTIKATVFTFIAILFFIRGDIKKYLKEAWDNKVVRSFIYLFAIYVVGLLWSENIKEGLYWVKSIKYGLYLIVFYAFVDGRYISKVMTAFLLGMLVSELTSYGMIFRIMPWSLDISGIHFYTAPSPVDPSPFLHHIHYGVALSLTVVLLGYQVYKSDRELWIKVLMSVFVLTASANIFATGGRTGYITFILLIFTLALFYLKRWAVVAILFVVFVVGSAYKFSPVVQAKVNQTSHSITALFDENPNFNTSLGVRAGIYYYGIKALESNPLFGLGTGDSMDKIKEVAPSTWHGNAQPHEHNQFFSVLMKVGVIGLIIYLNIFYQIFKYKQEDKELRFIMIFATLAIAFGTLTTQFNLRFFLPLWVVMLAVTLISKERRTIDGKIDDKKVLFQTVGAGVLFSSASLLHQLF